MYNVRLRWSRFLGYSPTYYVPAATAWWKQTKQKKKNDTLSLIFDSFSKSRCVFFTIFKWWCATSREHQTSIYSLFYFTCVYVYDGHSFDLSSTMTLTLRRYDVHQQQHVVYKTRDSILRQRGLLQLFFLVGKGKDRNLRENYSGKPGATREL